MRGRWVLAIGASVAALGGLAFFVFRSAESAPKDALQVTLAETELGRPPETLVQTALPQQVQIPPKGFDTGRAARVEELHMHVVAALDDLDPANGVRRIKTPTGERVVKVPSRFGASRMEVHISHNGEMYNTGTTRPGTGTSDPFLLIVSAHGKPLTEENLSWPKPASLRGTSIQEPQRQLTEAEKESAKHMEALRKESEKRHQAIEKERLDALRKVVARANRGLDSGIETSDAYGWAKPLKLTKAECLPCHAGMKVGDTVGIIAYMHGK